MPHINNQELARPSLYIPLGIVLAALVLVAVFLMKIPNFIRNGTYSLLREGLKEKAVWTTRDMETITGQHFIVRYTNGNQKDAELVLATAEQFYGPIAAKYGFSSSRKIPVIVYPSRAELNRNFGWPANESAMGVYWAGVIRVLSPTVWVPDQDPLSFQETFKKSGPMAHEFTHLVVDYVTAGNYTRWFTEGMAQYEEYKLTGFEFDEPTASLDQPLYSLSQMDRDFDNLPNQPLAYRQSYLAVRYIAEEYGEGALKSILINLARGKNMELALQSVLGMEMQQFEAKYQKWGMEKEKLHQL
ncbi:hypothetical protein Desca_2714 [Desulfotomaculum nigrificans CO-1-SRB]|uniref:Peptidase MA-like domain-containing protein n=1 Tax=Desulfotomaculum nigrificans (strain DSM 14880 / VKM B-2319 / CO-1-SRB) TaxID=868595 RepID=F6B6A8_DESCC|nr:collagenase [Desulfotomaculum nigrificans]AEF95531.1 hypothetical protein Desca_2714 [Desulfotomaculum nigrificans CO-1-SRB]